jgi:hypothetical protein
VSVLRPARVRIPLPTFVSEPFVPPLWPPTWIIPETVVLIIAADSQRFAAEKIIAAACNRPNIKPPEVKPLISKVPFPSVMGLGGSALSVVKKQSHSALTAGHPAGTEDRRAGGIRIILEFREALLAAPPSLVIIALPAFEVPLNSVVPGFDMPSKAPSFLIFPSAAVDPSLKSKSAAVTVL